MAGRFDLNRLTHPRDDKCGIQSFYAQSVGPGTYMTTNLVPKASGVNPLSVGQLNIYPREGYGLNNRAIDADSMLRNQPVFNSAKCNIRNQSRPYLTVPFMGNGRGNSDIESRLLHSEQVRLGKECGTVTEQFFDQQYTPQIPLLAKYIQNPNNLIQEVASGGAWQRGGIPTREYIRDINC
jgi:hypothetical protein